MEWLWSAYTFILFYLKIKVIYKKMIEAILRL